MPSEPPGEPEAATDRSNQDATAVGDEAGDKAEGVSQDVSLELTVSLTVTSRPTLLGQTNLPDGTSIMTSVEGVSTEFLGQQETTVDNGAFRAGPFGPVGGLPPGRFVAGATMPIPRLQDASVRAIIGEDGENLTGPLVEQGAVGVTVSVEERFQIGTDNAVARGQEQRVRHVAEAGSVLEELRQLAREGRGMESLRDRDDLAKLRQCGEEMRRHQPAADALRTRAQALPRSLGVDLAIAATFMNRCVSCLPQALDDCTMAEASLDDAEAVLRTQ